MDNAMGSQRENVITLQWEKVSDIFDEFQEMANEHFKEIYWKEINIDPSIMKNVEDQGMLLTLTARCNSIPVGYYSCAIAPSIYSKGEYEARDVGIFVKKEFRGEGITTSMQSAMDAELKKFVDAIYVSYPYESSIPEKAGYIKQEIIYKRVL